MAMPSMRSTLQHLLLLIFIFVLITTFANATGFLKVQRKFKTNSHTIADLRAHDAHRNSRMLAATVDLPLGGKGLPTDAGLYFAQIGIGTPPKNYFVQVDTGSDILWVNCINCKQCPAKSDLEGVELALYDPKASQTSSLVGCDDNFCKMMYGEPTQCLDQTPCQYSVLYGDGSQTVGYFVTDSVTYNQISSSNQTTTVNANVSFGCGAQQSVDFGASSGALDGILGFGQANSSMLSQLASEGKVKKIFSHCLDTVNGGGIFAIGEVAEPKVKTTPLVPNMPHYNVNMMGIEVGGNRLQLPSDLFETGDSKGTIIDSGTTLTYIAEDAYEPLMDAIFSKRDIKFHTVQDVLCFSHNDSVDEEFPEVSFIFEGSLKLTVYPHDYLFQNGEGVYCVGWLNGGAQTDAKNVFLMGDLVLSNKFFIYDLEKNAIGWTDYNCSSSIKIEDDNTGAVLNVDAHNLSSGNMLQHGIVLMMLLIISCYLVY